MSVIRVYVEKKSEFAVEAHSVMADLKSSLGINEIDNLRLINRYDVQGLSELELERVLPTVFSEPTVDMVYLSKPEHGEGDSVFAIEYLPGQFDQRADSCAQCIQLLLHGERPTVKNARVYIISGNLTKEQLKAIKGYLINPVDCREASLAAVTTLNATYEQVNSVETLVGFIGLDINGLSEFVTKYGLAMDVDDIAFCQKYFKEEEKRDPTITEIKMIDTYWSDHCRHTTFSTNIEKVSIEDEWVKDTYTDYQKTREVLYKGRTDKPVTLMDLAVIGAKKLKAEGKLMDLDESDEINACTVKIKVDVDGVQEDWLLLFKNETHNHPTEIEPFGGAATCLGGAIRDPLSGRAYVYQAMRVTGAANPLVSLEETIQGKLPQRKIVTGAAAGYSSYGNQIGLATGQVCEIYHPGYAAKRMEIGAVIGAAPARNVVREVPEPGDVVILLGGRTGRDGCGGATGSSKSHTVESLESCGAEVQKGNAPVERKIQRLFRNPEVTKLIRRCNDFGAGGVSVAIGELADGLCISLDKVPKKYDGLDGTELAISESQERMACVVRRSDMKAFMELCAAENLEATLVAEVTKEARLVMDWAGERIVDLSREFLNSNGAPKKTDVSIPAAAVKPPYSRAITKADIIEHMSELNICSQKGLAERFDSTNGSATVLMPFGGEQQLTPSQAMAAKLPVRYGETNTTSVMAWGFNPYISEQSPYHGAIYAVIESVAKLVATGGSRNQCWLTFQEFFERTKNNPLRWGKPMAALLGAYKAQSGLLIGAIGGKDSMSGSFEDLDVPPTLVSFAVSLAKADKVTSPEFKLAGRRVAMLLPKYDENGLPDFESVNEVFDKVTMLIEKGWALSCWALTGGGLCEALCKMSFGNEIGVKLTRRIDPTLFYNAVYGGFVVELSKYADAEGLEVIGATTSKYVIISEKDKLAVDMSSVQKGYESKLEPVFPYHTLQKGKAPQSITYKRKKDEKLASPAVKIAKPKVLIPVFPGTNCEYDTARAFEKAGAQADIFVIRNLTSKQIEESVEEFAKAIGDSQIIMIPGGFSGGDEPDGSAKFITSFFRNPRIKEEVATLLGQRDGLMMGICNGFQALLKLGLIECGEIKEMTGESPTLTYNLIGRHQSMMVNTRVCSNKSPWLARTRVGDIHNVPVSHGEGRFIANEKLIQKLTKGGQIATQYVDLSGQPTNNVVFNPNGSVMAIEGVTSPDGRIFGKMAHSERIGANVSKNVPGEKDQQLFRAGVEYFTR